MSRLLLLIQKTKTKFVPEALAYWLSMNNNQAYNDGGKLALGSINKIVKYEYASGSSKTYIESPKFKIYKNMVEMEANYYSLAGDRASFTLRFYDSSDNLLGRFYCAKNSSSWTTGNATTMTWYNSAGTATYTIDSSKFSGSSYGNGYVGFTLKLQNGFVIYYNNYTWLSTHFTSKPCIVEQTGLDLTKATKYSIEVNSLINTYSTGNVYVKAGQYSSLFIPTRHPALTKGYVDKVDFFKDGSGLALYSFENNAKDQREVFNGTATNVTYSTGKFGQAAGFNGSNSSITSSLFHDSGNYTVSCWAKGTGLTSTSVGFLYGLGVGRNEAHFSNGLRVLCNGKYYDYSVATMGINSTDFFHILISTIAYVPTLYINGVSLPTPTAGVATSNPAASLHIGRRTDSTYYFSGSIDQFRYFNRALTQTEVTALYNEVP